MTSSRDKIEEKHQDWQEIAMTHQLFDLKNTIRLCVETPCSLDKPLS